MIFLSIYLNLLYMFRATNSPIFRSTFWLYIQLWYNAPRFLPTGDKVEMDLNLVTGRQQNRCIVPKLYTVKRCSWRWASLSPETCTADANISIKRSINENCCILLVAYIAVLMMHGLTNVKYLPLFYNRHGKVRNCGQGSSVGIAIDYGLDGPGSNPGGDKIFRPSRPALGPIQHPVKWVPGLSRG